MASSQSLVDWIFFAIVYQNRIDRTAFTPLDGFPQCHYGCRHFVSQGINQLEIRGVTDQTMDIFNVMEQIDQLGF